MVRLSEITTEEGKGKETSSNNRQIMVAEVAEITTSLNNSNRKEEEEEVAETINQEQSQRKTIELIGKEIRNRRHKEHLALSLKVRSKGKKIGQTLWQRIVDSICVMASMRILRC